jgi:multiple sugar transport system permease protein
MLAASSTDMRTLANGLALFVGKNTIQYGAAFAGTLISLLPMLGLYLFGQKYFVQGMASSGLKT